MKPLLTLKFALIPVFIFLLLTRETLACPVCFSEEGATLEAFRWSTLFLSLVPFGFIGGFIYWYWSKVKKQGGA